MRLGQLRVLRLRVRSTESVPPASAPPHRTASRGRGLPLSGSLPLDSLACSGVTAEELCPALVCLLVSSTSPSLGLRIRTALCGIAGAGCCPETHTLLPSTERKIAANNRDAMRETPRAVCWIARMVLSSRRNC